MLELKDILISNLIESDFNRRTSIDQTHIDELAASVSYHGRFLKPLMVRKKTDTAFEVVKGYRRLAAGRKLEYTSLPCIILPDLTDDATCLLISVTLNSNEKPNPIEDALTYERLFKQHNISQRDIALAAGLGESGRMAVNRCLQLLRLCKTAQDYVATGELCTASGIVLLAINDHAQQAEIAELAASGGWSVRKLDSYIKAIDKVKMEPDEQPSAYQKSDEQIDANRILENIFDTKVLMKTKKNGGLKITFDCDTPEDVEKFFSAVNSISFNKSEENSLNADRANLQ